MVSHPARPRHPRPRRIRFAATSTISALTPCTYRARFMISRRKLIGHAQCLGRSSKPVTRQAHPPAIPSPGRAPFLVHRLHWHVQTVYRKKSIRQDYACGHAMRIDMHIDLHIEMLGDIFRHVYKTNADREDPRPVMQSGPRADGCQDGAGRVY